MVRKILSVVIPRFPDGTPYKGIKDQFQDEAKAGMEIKFEYEEITKLFARYEVKKSLNTSNYDNVVTVGFKVMI